MSPLTEPTRLVLRRTWQPMDPDAAAYITAVEAADTAAGSPGGLEERTKIAIDNFVLSCKADGIWNAIKASCILAGARTLNGALVPLVGTAPTRFGTENGWNYNRKTGLQGNGTNNYLNSNRANNEDSQNNSHNACWVSSVPAGSGASNVLMANRDNTGRNFMDVTPSINRTRFNNRSNSQGTTLTAAHATGLYGHSRIVNNQSTYKTPMQNGVASYNSQVPDSGDVTLYASSFSDGVTFTNWSLTRLAFYSIGESLNLALLDARVTDLINAFATAIP